MGKSEVEQKVTFMHRNDQASNHKKLKHQKKIGVWKIIPALILLIIIELILREKSVERDFASLKSSASHQKRQAVENLVQGCSAQQEHIL
ncbi:hypothetical protein HRE53_19060 [Acaryochloris sp. 'Moss Beach']|uniref:hypothetical protein n=1 Tax=Acaryochloris sp. 'Moss Beach' TaxID=2740837 RepID=UPI001F3B254F|nr:hypothetical protein [Acaryochloris sp. 'Moss Beach']UJB68590.1 hypothetical protein HRE53_19060 [Acaryochloris sp. 'Moss Beach']